MAGLSSAPPLRATTWGARPIPTPMRRRERSTVKVRAVWKARLAPVRSRRPMAMATAVAPPMGNMAAAATTKVMKGTPMFTAPRAAAPTPWPTKIPSTMLYR